MVAKNIMLVYKKRVPVQIGIAFDPSNDYLLPHRVAATHRLAVVHRVAVVQVALHNL